MTEQELVALEVEKRAYQAVISSFIKHNIDIRMNTQFDEFLRGLEDKVREIQQTIDQNI